MENTHTFPLFIALTFATLAYQPRLEAVTAIKIQSLKTKKNKISKFYNIKFHSKSTATTQEYITLHCLLGHQVLVLKHHMCDPTNQTTTLSLLQKCRKTLLKLKPSSSLL